MFRLKPPKKFLFYTISEKFSKRFAENNGTQYFEGKSGEYGSRKMDKALFRNIKL